MSLVQESLNQKPPAGLSIRDRAEMGVESAKEKALVLLDERAVSGLSAREWAELGLSSAKQTVLEVETLVKNK